MRSRVCAATLIAVALGCLLLRPIPAEAHAGLVSSDPSDGSTVDAAPDQVSLTFDEAVDEPAFISVTSPDGDVLVSGEAAVFDASVVQSLPESDSQGTYTIAFRVTSLDGHPVTGTLTFNVGYASQPAGTVAVPGPETTGGNSFISEHVASLTIAMAAITLAICLAILKAGRSQRQKQASEPPEPSHGDA